MCLTEEAEEEIMAGLGAPFSPLCPHDVTDLRGAVTATIGRRMEAEVGHGAWMESYLVFEHPHCHTHYWSGLVGVLFGLLVLWLVLFFSSEAC